MLNTALQGVTVLEVASYLPGPVCTQILADMGARVIKIERPGGDPLRSLMPHPPDRENPIFAAINRGKQSIELDLKTAAGVAVLRDLAQQADVLIDGFRPGVLERLGLGATALRAANPRLIYCGLSGFGDASGWRDQAGHDLNFVALSGFLAMTTAGGVPAMPGTQLADMISGLGAATAVLAALQQRVTSGEGTTIDLAMSDMMRWLMLPTLNLYRAGLSRGPEQANPLGGAMAYYRCYHTADGRYLAVAAIEPHFWARFCEALGRPDLIEIQYDDAAQPRIQAALEAVIGSRPLAYWREQLADLDVCVSVALTLDEVEALAQHRERGFGDRFPVA